MARQVLPIVGAVVGGFIGGPQGAQWGYAIGSLIGNAVDPVEMQGRKLGDAPTQVAAEGGARAIVFGKGCVRALVILERGGRRVIKQRQSSGGKGSGPTTVNERALWTYAIGLCEAVPGGSVLRIWEDEKLVYDVTPESTIQEDTEKYAEGFRFYDGSDDQLPDPALEALHPSGEAPYYRGTAYMVFPQRDLTDFGERVPNYRVEISSTNAPTTTEWYVTGNASGVTRFQVSESGADFETPLIVSPPGRSRLLSSGSRIVAYNNNQMSYTDDGGGNWTDVADPPTSSGGGYKGIYKQGRFWIPLGNQGFAYSSNGSSWTERAIVAGAANYALAIDGSRILLAGLTVGAAGSANNTRVSYDGGGAFGASFLSLNATVTAADAATGIVVVGGHGHALAYSQNWEDFTQIPSPFANGSGSASGHFIGSIRFGYTKRGTPLWVAVSSSNTGGTPGQTAISSDGTAFILIDGFGQDVLDMDYFGGRWIGVGESGVIKYLEDPNVGWVSLPNTWGSGFRLTSIARRYAIEAVIADKISLASVVSVFHARCRQTDVDFDVSEITELITGTVVEQTVTGAEAVNSVIGAFFLDPADYDSMIRYVRRGKASVATLTSEDLIEEPEQARRNNAIEYPKKLHLFYQSSTSAYATTKATSARYSADVAVVGEASVSTPVTFDDLIQPAEIAAKLHKVLWAEAEGEIEWYVTDEWTELVPTDVVTLNYSGRVVRARVVQVQFELGQIRLKMRVDRQSAYRANVTQVAIPPAPTPPQPTTPSQTVLAIMDIPALTDNADTLNYYAAMSGETDSWAGAILQQSLDAGATFGDIASASVNAIMGETLQEVTAASPAYTDTTNEIVVRLFTSDELESRTQEIWLSQGGAFALSWMDGEDRRWELMQFRDAEEIGDKTYRLSHLMRGRKGTEAVSHPAGSKFVFLDTTVLRLPAQSAWIGTDLYHRAVSNGLSPESAEIHDDLYSGNSQREWPVAHLLLSSMASLITAEVIPRHRFGTSMNPVRSVNWIGYRWAVSDGTNTINRDGTGPVETFDVSGWSSPVTVTVSQLNRITGPGPSVSEEISP